METKNIIGTLRDQYNTLSTNNYFREYLLSQSDSDAQELRKGHRLYFTTISINYTRLILLIILLI